MLGKISYHLVLNISHLLSTIIQNTESQDNTPRTPTSDANIKETSICITFLEPLGPGPLKHLRIFNSNHILEIVNVPSPSNNINLLKDFMINF